MVHLAFAAFATEVRKYDSHRLVVTGDSILRPSAWHREHEGKWTSDTRAQVAEMITVATPAPINGISLHLYEDQEWGRLGQACGAEMQFVGWTVDGGSIPTLKPGARSRTVNHITWDPFANHGSLAAAEARRIRTYFRAIGFAESWRKTSSNCSKAC
jgi:hypothetical protein